ncbi:hypothetical protein JRQ81_014590 [Phrynocephalus forsythii]|uniref:Uncharacterized protein n=1 Tax=Phrynocephalus forsythii TaxID=171643 RepID=A0A9Q0XZ02_9SAUR|nr:hypothetical protein JRQ81_014590 [Phrynocephalus forsythii]
MKTKQLKSFTSDKRIQSCNDLGDHIVIISTSHMYLPFLTTNWSRRHKASHPGYPGGFRQAKQLHQHDLHFS